jgi:hypothetical protein
MIQYVKLNCSVRSRFLSIKSYYNNFSFRYWIMWSIVIFWHRYVLREEGTAFQGLTPAHCILLIAHIALCKSCLTPAHCISLIVYLTPYTLCLTSYILRLMFYILRLTPYTLHLNVLCLTSYIPHLISYIVSYRIVFCTMWHVYILCVRHIHDPMLLP